jgi:hypothetical protein
MKMSQESNLELKRETFMELKTTLGWEGDGTQNNPIIVDNLFDLPSDLSINRIKDYIVFKDLTISSINFSFCRNITVQRCEIHSLYISVCHNMILEENAIKSFNISFGGNNLIIRNEIPRYDLSNAKERVFEKALAGALGFVLFCLICFVIVPLIYVIQSDPNSFLLLFILLFIAILGSGFLCSIFIIFKMYNLPHNKFEMNIAIDERSVLL